MDDFYDDLKDNLENRPEPPFEESAWVAMQKKMKEEEKPRRGLASWWWLGLLLIPLLFSNAWMYLQMGKADKLLQSMELQRDTIFKTHIIYQVDTVYQTRIVQQKVTTSANEISSSTNSPTIHLQDFSFLSNGTSTFNNNSFSPFTKNSFGENSFFFAQRPSSKNYESQTLKEKSNNINTGSDFSKNNLSTENISMLPSLTLETIESPTLLTQVLDLQALGVKKRSKWRQNTLLAFRPKSFSLSAGAGVAFPINLGIEESDGNSFTFQTNIYFSPNLSLWMGLDYLRLQLKTDELENSFGIPPLMVSNDDYEFENAEANLRMLQFSTGMQYSFLAKRKLNPYVGIGYSILKIKPYDAEYEYKDRVQNVEVKFSQDVPGQDLMTNLWIMKAGVQYRFYKKWSGQLEGYYRSNWNSDDKNVPNILGIQAKLMRKF